jgi:hypothetical protein
MNGCFNEIETKLDKLDQQIDSLKSIQENGFKDISVKMEGLHESLAKVK